MATRLKIKTTEGDIIIRLYDETPKHRDNFLKLAKEGYFNGTLFHRVIKDFMIQGGDPDSKNAPKGKMLGTGGPDYTIPAEFVYPQYFHKRGALSAARTGDEVNPDKESSGSQFYIVWGKTFKPAELKQMEQQMAMQQEQQVFNQLTREHHEEIMNLRRTPFLDNQYTVFGEVEEGLDIVERIQNCNTDRNDRPTEDVKIETVDLL